MCANRTPVVGSVKRTTTEATKSSLTKSDNKRRQQVSDNEVDKTTCWRHVETKNIQGELPAAVAQLVLTEDIPASRWSANWSLVAHGNDRVFMCLKCPSADSLPSGVVTTSIDSKSEKQQHLLSEGRRIQEIQSSNTMLSDTKSKQRCRSPIKLVKIINHYDLEPARRPLVCDTSDCVVRASRPTGLKAPRIEKSTSDDFENDSRRQPLPLDDDEFSMVKRTKRKKATGDTTAHIMNKPLKGSSEYNLIYTLIISSLLSILLKTQAQSIQSYWPNHQRNQQQHHPYRHQHPTVPMSLISPLIMQAQEQPATLSPATIRRQQQTRDQMAIARGVGTVADPTSHLKGQLMIGQHYNNFSSIIPYSVEQDPTDYGASQEDPIVNGGDTDEQTAGQTSRQHSFDQQPTQDQQLSAAAMAMATISSKWRQLQQDYLNINLNLNLNLNQHHQHPTLEGSSMKSYSRIETGSSDNNNNNMVVMNNNDENDNQAKSRALLPLDSNRLILPQMQQIKSRFNQGCVGGTKCQFFAFCWMSGGSLGASCGLLMTCCVTPSRQEIQPGFYGPVVNDPYCGRSTSKINRIVGGTDASFGQFPWQAFVQVGGSRCGGALISSRHVVTAGHCVARSQHSPASIKVTLGDYILNSDIESIPHEVFSVVEVLLHPNFRFTPQADRYDVAVLELDRTASYKDNIKPICLPQKDASFVGRVAYVAGWGALQAGSKLRPKVLQHVAVPVIENHVCEGWHRRKGIDIRIYDEMMCAGYELGQRDACQGDSGGPLMLNQFGVWYLVGIVSAGYSCAKQYQPGIYHRVSSSSDWISSNVYQQGANK